MVWPASRINIPQAGGQAMTVSLVVLANKKLLPPTNKVIPPKKTPEVESSTHRTVVPEKLATKKPQTEYTKPEKSKDTPTQLASNNTAIAENFSQTTSSKSTTKQLRVVLRRAFNTHFYYPRLAIRRGWSGEVHLSLRIEPNGTLSHVRILKGSGFGLLDKAAMKSLDKVKILPAAIALLDGQSLDLTLPVEYRLL